MNIGDYLFFKDKRNETAGRAANLLAGRTCGICAKYCKKKDKSDSCWEFTVRDPDAEGW